MLSVNSIQHGVLRQGTARMVTTTESET